VIQKAARRFPNLADLKNISGIGREGFHGCDCDVGAG
jgi:hypothetical protein